MKMGRREAAAGLTPAARSATLNDRQGMSSALRWSIFALIVVGYVMVAGLLMLLVHNNGMYPTGSDTMFYVYRGDFLYRSITQEGNWYPLIDMQWYNGVQTWRYWSPLSAFIYAACQAIMGGSSMSGYVLCCGVFYVLNALTWLILGCTHRRPWLGAFLGFIWFFIPGNSFMFFSEGVMARAMSMAVVPWFIFGVYDYLRRPRVRFLVQILVSFILIIMSHVGWAGMLAITLLIYLFFHFLMGRKKEDRVGAGPIVICVLLGFLITGVWLYPSLKGGITGIDSSSIMKNFFQPLLRTLNPFGTEGQWNRWLDPNVNQFPYFGCVAFFLGIFGCLFSQRTTAPGFATAIAVCLLTSTVAYSILVYLPGSQYLWMLRFVALALSFLLVSFFFWTSLKKGWQALFAVLLTAECILAFPIFLGDQNGLQPQERYSAMCQEALIDVGRDHTVQRFSAVEPVASITEGAYLIAGFGGDQAVPTSYGQGVQAAPQYQNIVRINEAAENGQYLYMFDRLLALGNDVVLVPLFHLDPVRTSPELLDAAAARSGYQLLAFNEEYRLYKLRRAPKTGHFGVVSKYRCAAIGADAGTIAMGFPAVEELDEAVLDAYTFDDLKDYETLYLAGFTYRDKAAAEELVLRLSENGTRVLILADGVPDEENTGSKTFLGVSCNRVNFQNGYPALDTIDGVLYCDLFPAGYAEDWQTVYVNGLDKVWGKITDVPEGQMDFYGTVKNDNIVFIGLALTYHYSLTQDAAVGHLLSHALQADPNELPQREIVPIDVDYHDNIITIDSPRDNVNTTLSYHDIFRPDRDIRSVNHLTVVDQGRTVIRLVYPYLVPGLCMTLAGTALTAGYLFLMKKRLRALAQRRAEAQPETESIPAEDTPQDQAPDTQ